MIASATIHHIVSTACLFASNLAPAVAMGVAVRVDIIVSSSKTTTTIKG